MTVVDLSKQLAEQHAALVVIGREVRELRLAIAELAALTRNVTSGLADRVAAQSELLSRRAQKRPRIVCLCGSTRFWQTFQRLNLEETLAGRVVLSIGGATASDEEHGLTSEQKVGLDELHLAKIDLADEVLVLNVSYWTCSACGKACETLPFEVHPPLSKCCRAAAPMLPYVGESTRREIAYAESKGKPVRYLNPPGDAS